jgi:hypothetical protein
LRIDDRVLKTDKVGDITFQFHMYVCLIDKEVWCTHYHHEKLDVELVL